VCPVGVLADLVGDDLRQWRWQVVADAGDDRLFIPSGGWHAPGHEVEWCLDGERRCMGQTARFQETLRRLAMIDEGFVEDEAGLRLGQAGASALDLKTVALLQLDE
jgi:hypothetical protein